MRRYRWKNREAIKEQRRKRFRELMEESFEHYST